MKKIKHYALSLLLMLVAIGPLLATPVQSASAAQVVPTAASNITYVDGSGSHTLNVPQGTVATMSSSASTINISWSGQSYALKNVSEFYVNGLTVKNLIPFYSTTVTKVSFDNVNFQNGIDMSGNSKLQEMSVTNSTFGACDYSFAIHCANALTKLTIDNSSFNADVRICSNSNLASAQVSNSIMKSNVTQYCNKAGYYTDFQNNKFDYAGICTKTISSGGMSNHDIFYINANGTPIGASKFDVTQAGLITAVDTSGNTQTLGVPAGVNVKSVTYCGTTLTITLSNGQKATFQNTQKLSFNNVNIATCLSLVSCTAKFTDITITNSQTQLIDLAYISTLKTVNITGTAISQSSGYLSIYNNPALQSVNLADTSVNGCSGYISVYNNKSMNNFQLTNVYAHGYMSAYNLGSTDIQISNSKFDDYINTNQVINGQGGNVIPPVDEAPVINASDKALLQGKPFDPMIAVSATDKEDGDLTSKIIITANDVNTSVPGTYHITYSVTDSAGNTTTKTITVTVRSNTFPVINAPSQTIKVGSTFDPMAGVTATDKEDGDLTSRIILVSNTVDTSKPGVYTVTYSVTDNDGNTLAKTIQITVVN
ncbi:MAG: DUF5011 domain-containing protein [Streptococcaceae bacterium]|nr:DUF5011 domain-containing protein [Streptococcaceae bacterium]